MANFAKKLEDASDEELYSWVNELDFRVVPLASDELTRRYIRKLTKSTDKLNKSTEKYSKALVGLTIIMIIMAIIQIAMSYVSIPESQWARLTIEIIFLISIVFIVKGVTKEFTGSR